MGSTRPHQFFSVAFQFCSQTSVTVEPADGGRQSNEFEPGGSFSVSNDFQIKKLLGKTNDEIRVYLNFLIFIEYLNSRAIPSELCALNCQTEFFFLFLILEGYYFPPVVYLHGDVATAGGMFAAAARFG